MKIGFKYYLADGENYFIYRMDRYSDRTIRVELYNSKNEVIHSSLARGGMIDADRSHQSVLNEFEIIKQMEIDN